MLVSYMPLARSHFSCVVDSSASAPRVSPTRDSKISTTILFVAPPRDECENRRETALLPAISQPKKPARGRLHYKAPRSQCARQTAPPGSPPSSARRPALRPLASGRPHRHVVDPSRAPRFRRRRGAQPVVCGPARSPSGRPPSFDHRTGIRAKAARGRARGADHERRASTTPIFLVSRRDKTRSNATASRALSSAAGRAV